MTTRDDGTGSIGNDNGCDQAFTLPKKKSVRWGEITEHHHERAMTTENPTVVNADSLATNERYPNELSNPQLHQQQHDHNHHQRQKQLKTMKQNSDLPKNGKNERGNRSKCRLPGHSSHFWKDCPNNPFSNKYCGINHRTMNYSSHQLSSLSSSGGCLAERAAAQRGNVAVGVSSLAIDVALPVLTNDGESPSPSSSTIPKKKRSPPVVLPSSSKRTRQIASSLVRSASGGTANHLFNTTDSARPIPRKTTTRKTARMHPFPSPKNPAAEPSLRDGLGSGSTGVPRKEIGLHQQSQPQQQSRGTMPQRMDVTNVKGHWRRRPAICAPSGMNAQALRKHTSTRLLVGSSAKKNKETGDGEAGSGGGGDYQGEDAIENESEHSAARTYDGRGGSRGNRDDGRLMKWTKDGSRVRDSLEGEDTLTSLSSQSSSLSGVGRDIRMSDDNNDHDSLSITPPRNGLFHEKLGEDFDKDKFSNGDDIMPPAASGSLENVNNRTNELIKRKSATASEKELPNSAVQIGLGRNAASFSSKEVIGDVNENDGDHDNDNNNSCKNSTVEDCENKKESEFADEMEQDLFYLVEKSISLNEQWAKRCMDTYYDNNVEELEVGVSRQQCQESIGDDSNIYSHAEEPLTTSSAKKAVATSRSTQQQQQREHQQSYSIMEGLEATHAICDWGGEHGPSFDSRADIMVLARGEEIGPIHDHCHNNYDCASQFSHDAHRQHQHENEPMDKPNNNDGWGKGRDKLMRNHCGQKISTQNSALAALGAMDDEDEPSQKKNIANGQLRNVPFPLEEGHATSSSLSATPSAEIDSSLLVNDVSVSRNTMALISDSLKQQQIEQIDEYEKQKCKIANRDENLPDSKKPGDNNAVIDGEDAERRVDDAAVRSSPRRRYSSDKALLDFPASSSSSIINTNGRLKCRAASCLKNSRGKDFYGTCCRRRAGGTAAADKFVPGAESFDNDEDDDNVDVDVDIPAFLTCNKCSMVFAHTNEAQEHEINCVITNNYDTSHLMQHGRVFYDKTALLKHIVAHYLQTGKVVNEKDKIYFRPISPDEVSPMADDSDGVEEIDGDKNDENNGNEDNDGKESEEEEEEEWGNGGNESDEEAAEMNLVKHLCSTTVDPTTGLPTQKLTVMCGDSETLYDFRVDIKTSSICNAGHGAYLTYLGARALKKSAYDLSTRLMKEHIALHDVGTLKPLMAQTIGGRRMSVRITGKNLHHNDNIIYWSKKRLDKFAEFERETPTRGNCQSPNKSFDESQVDCRIHQEVQKLRDRIPEGKRIGFLGILSESDYIPDDSQLFWSFPKGIFQLGRYGPHKPEDRKKLLHFNFKNFIHNYEPSEWSYDVPEALQDCIQMVDITDDATGEVHELARAHTPVYVNEVGHNPNLHRNVLIRDKDDRSIYYYVAIDRKHAMKKGDSVELLVDYGDSYEEVRERKGYGRVNTLELIQRNLYEREELEKDIRSLTVYGMFDLVRILTEKIFDPINKSIQRSCTIEGRKKSVFRGERDLIARRRLHWIGEKLTGRVLEYFADSSIDSKSELIVEIKHSTQNWKISEEEEEFYRLFLPDELDEESLYRCRSPSLTDVGLTHRIRSRIAPIYQSDDNFPGWIVFQIPRLSLSASGPRADKYWSHPDLPRVVVRSAKGVRDIMDFMSTEGVGVIDAYKKFRGITKYFKCHVRT